MQSGTRKIVIAIMLATLTCVATMLIKVPLTFLNGYVNLGIWETMLFS